MRAKVDPCRHIQKLLVLRPDDWSERERQDVAEHMASCAECAALAQHHAGQEDLLRRTIPSGVRQPQWSMLQARIEQQRRWNRMKSNVRAMLSGVVAVAAIAVLVLALTPLFTGNRLPEGMPAAGSAAPTVPTPTSTPTRHPATATATEVPIQAPATPLATATPVPATATSTHTPTQVPATATAMPTPALTSNPDFKMASGIEVLSWADPGWTLALVEDLGLGWVKLQVRWSEVEPNPGEYNWERLDAFVAVSQEAGLSVLLSIIEAPSWAREGEPGVGPPRDAKDLGILLSAVAGRYRGRVHAYEIWYGQNFGNHWKGAKLDASAYVALLEHAYQAIKAADPQAVVVSGALMPTGIDDGTYAISDLVYLRGMYDAGLGDVCDAVGAHPNGYANPPDILYEGGDLDPNRIYDDHRTFFFRNVMEETYEVMAENGDGGKPVWATQFGWGTVDGTGLPSNPGYDWTADMDEYEQAVYTVMAYRWAEAWGHAGGLFLWNLDAAVVAGAEDASSKYGLLYEDGLPRPIYGAVRAAMRRDLSEDAQGTGIFDWPVAGRIEQADGDTAVLGVPHSGLDIAAPTGTEVYAADEGIVSIATASQLYGNVVTVDHLNGFYTVYAHMETIAVTAGQPILRGNVIGTVGQTGMATGPHLHFEIHSQGVRVDPEQYLP